MIYPLVKTMARLEILPARSSTMKNRQLISRPSNACKHLPCMLIFTLTLLLPLISGAQTFGVEFPANSTIYQESEIPVKVVVAGLSCHNTVVKCHKGSVSPAGDCMYLYICSAAGIDILVRKGNKLSPVGVYIFEVKSLPPVRVTLGGLRGGKISRPALLAQQGLSASFFVSGNHWEECKVDSFSLLLLRNGVNISHMINKGNVFTNETTMALQQVQPGDRLLITDIKACAARSSQAINSLEFIIE